MSTTLFYTEKNIELSINTKNNMSDNDAYVIIHLVNLLEFYSDDIRAVEKIAAIILLPIYYAVHPDSSSVQSRTILRIMQKLDITSLMYKISLIINRHSNRNYFVAKIGSEISKSLKTL